MSLVLLIFCNICVAEIGDQGEYPPSFIKAAKRFAMAPSTNRYAEAKELARRLPECPIVYEHGSGMGVIRAYDWSKPSYKLTSKDVLTLVGRPFLITTNYNYVTYSYLALRSEHSSEWTLTVEIRNDYAVRSTLSGSGPPP
jgi:hypothetical protein